MDELASELLEIIYDILPSDVGGGAHAICLRPSLASQVGALINQYRQNKQMTQLALAQKMHVDAATISRHEHGVSIPLDMLPEYADNLGVKLNDLIPQDNLPIYTDEKQWKIDRAINEFQKLHNLSDEKLDKVLNLVNGLINLSLEDMGKDWPEK